MCIFDIVENICAVLILPLLTHIFVSLKSHDIPVAFSFAVFWTTQLKNFLNEVHMLSPFFYRRRLDAF